MRFNNQAHYYKARDAIFGMNTMASEPFSSNVYAPNLSSGPSSSEELVASFILSLGPAGRKESTIYIYASGASSMTMCGMASLIGNHGS